MKCRGEDHPRLELAVANEAIEGLVCGARDALTICHPTESQASALELVAEVASARGGPAFLDSRVT